MEDVLMSKIYQLKECLLRDERVLDLEAKEKRMEQDEEVMVLSYRFNCAQNDYNDALRHYEEGSQELLAYQKKLYESKKALESHPLVQDYLKAYKKVRELYHEMESVLFADFKENINCQEKK